MKYKYSIQRQFTIIFGCLMAGTILLCWFINNTFLERYYINNKKHAMLEAYRVINASSNNGTLASDKFDIQFQNICAKNNINIVILDAEAKTLKTSANNYELLSKQLLSYLFNQDTTEDHRTILDHEKYQMIALKDDRTQQDFIDLWGVLDNTCRKYQGKCVVGKSFSGLYRNWSGNSRIFDYYDGIQEDFRTNQGTDTDFGANEPFGL